MDDDTSDGENRNSKQRKRNRTFSVSLRLSHLIGYDEAPDNLQTWINSSCSAAMTSSTEAGRRLGDYNVKRVAFANVKELDIGFAAVETPDEGELFDCEFLACSNIIFFEFLGSPGSVAYIRCLGQLESNINSLDLESNRFKMKSSMHFHIATGDFLLIADQLELEELEQKKLLRLGPQEK